MDGGQYMKEKKEIQALKKELNDFYRKKEKEYKKNKAEIEALLARVQKEKNEIQSLHDRNEAILKDIKGTVDSKMLKIYKGMKPKAIADIFSKMIADGKIDDVFDIMIKLKEKKVTTIMKFLDIENVLMLTDKLKNYRVEDSIK